MVSSYLGQFNLLCVSTMHLYLFNLRFIVVYLFVMVVRYNNIVVVVVVLVVVVASSPSSPSIPRRRRKRQKTPKSTDKGKAEERERDNPMCGVCNQFPTNHFCSFLLPNKEKCGAPVCAICKGDDAAVTRCMKHLWSGTYIPSQETAQSQEMASSQELAASQESQQLPPLPPPTSIINQSKKIVAKKNQRLCSECNQCHTPSCCHICNKPLCTSCKLRLNGTLGKYCCAEHAKKTELIFGTTSVLQDKASSGAEVDQLLELENEQPSQTRPDLQFNVPSQSTTALLSQQTLVLPGGKSKKRKTKVGGGKNSNSLMFDDQDALLNQAVSFDVSSDIGRRIVSQLSCTLSPSTLRNNSIVGTVSRKVSNKVTSGQVFYEVCWNNSEYGVMQMSHSHICLGMSNYIQLKVETQQPKVPRCRNPRSDPYNNNGIIKIIDKSRGEDSDMSPCSSDCGSNGSIESEDTLGNCFFGDNHIDRARAAEPQQIDSEYLLVSDDEGDANDLIRTNVDELEGLEWDPKETLEPRPDKMLPRPCTLKPQFLSHFDTPMSSFHAFLPQGMFEKIMFESNKYARKKIANLEKPTISGNNWKQDITIYEMMQFMGILIHMTLLPIPGRDYRYYWTKSHLYPWVDCMKLSRFKQIRAVLHFNSNDSNERSSDPLHWVRPIYATIQETIGRYVDVGSEFSLDEASAACRSSFGRHLIVYNPSKNCGKFHFRFYLLCCSFTYACIKIRIHVKTDEMMEEDAFQGGTDESAKVLNKLILDMTKPLYNKGITVNFNNYYASPAAAIDLLKHRVFCRGTLRRNKRLIPSYILFKKSEAKNKESRGAVKIAVNKKFGLVAAGWIDGNPVHMISSADTERLTTVQRKVGGEKQTVQAPEVVLSYNKGMDGVDRHDQYRMLFSMCSRHGFKKYPVKLILALFDIALTNAVLHFKLRWDGTNDPFSRMSRVDFMQDIADKLISTNREWELDGDAEGINTIFGGTTPRSTQLFSPEAARVGSGARACIIEALEKYSAMLKKNKRKCQICEYERRGTGRYKNVLYCSSHGIRACGISRPPRKEEGNDHLLVHQVTGEPVTDLSWILGDDGQLTCMEKFHMLYLPKNLFKVKQTNRRGNQSNTTTMRFARIISTSELYKARQLALGIPSKQRPTKYNKDGSKNNNNRKKSTQSDSDTDSEEDLTNNNNGPRDDSSTASPPPRRSQRRSTNNKKTIVKQRTGQVHSQKNNKKKEKNNNENESNDGSDDDDPASRSVVVDYSSESSEWDPYNKEAV